MGLQIIYNWNDYFLKSINRLKYHKPIQINTDSRELYRWIENNTILFERMQIVWVAV